MNGAAFHTRVSPKLHGFMPACLLAVTGFVMPDVSMAAAGRIPIVECELNGVSPGGTADEIRAALGEPEVVSKVMTLGDDFPHFEYLYDGLRIVLSMHGRTVLGYVVTSDKYRLRSGVGVGSTRKEIEAALGPAGYVKSGGVLHMTYLVSGPDGLPIPVQLTIKLDGDIATELSLISR